MLLHGTISVDRIKGKQNFLSFSIRYLTFSFYIVFEDSIWIDTWLWLTEQYVDALHNCHSSTQDWREKWWCEIWKYCKHDSIRLSGRKPYPWICTHTSATAKWPNIWNCSANSWNIEIAKYVQIKYWQIFQENKWIRMHLCLFEFRQTIDSDRSLLRINSNEQSTCTRDSLQWIRSKCYQ